MGQANLNIVLQWNESAVTLGNYKKSNYVDNNDTGIWV